MVKSEYTILTLVMMKKCPIALVHAGKCWDIHASIFCSFQKFPAWDWNSLLTLDERFETEIKTENLEHTGDNAEQVKITENEVGSRESCIVEELPSRKTAIGSKVDRSTCRKLLRSIISLTYLLENDVDKVNRVHSVLNELKKDIVFDLPKESRITLLPAKESIKIKKEKEEKQYAATETQKNFENFPILKRKDCKCKRVGKAKEKFLPSSKILIEKDEMHLEDDDILIKQVVDDNLDYENMPSFDIEKAALNQVDQRGKKIGDEQRSYKNGTPRTNLTAGDLSDISHNRMLNGSVINSFQQMLKSQYIHANGLQDPVPGQGLNFAICCNVPFVQILHDVNLHWVAISTYGCNPEVLSMDSLFNGRIADHTKIQICSIVNYEQDVL